MKTINVEKMGICTSANSLSTFNKVASSQAGAIKCLGCNLIAWSFILSGTSEAVFLVVSDPFMYKL